MAPILFNAALSLAGNVIDGISEHFSKPRGVPKAGKVAEPDFDAELAKTQAVSSPTSATAMPLAAPEDSQGVLMNQVLGSPEIATALASADPAQPVQVEMSASGSIALRNATGNVQTLKVSDDTRALVEKLYTAHTSTLVPRNATPTAVLAVDPSHAAAAEWSKLPLRAA